MTGDEGSRLEAEHGGVGEGGLLFLAWIALVLASLLCLNECDALAVRVMVEPYVWGRFPSGGLETRTAVSYIASAILLAGFLLHFTYFSWSLVQAWRWKKILKIAEDHVSKGEWELARENFSRNPSLTCDFREEEDSLPEARTTWELFWSVLFLVLLVAPAALELFGSLTARDGAPSLGYHGTCLVAGAMLVLPTAVNLSLLWSLGPRRRFVVWSLVERIKAGGKTP